MRVSLRLACETCGENYIITGSGGTLMDYGSKNDKREIAVKFNVQEDQKMMFGLCHIPGIGVCEICARCESKIGESLKLAIRSLKGEK